MSKFIFYIALAISIAWIFSFFIEYGDEINTSITSSANQLIIDFPISTRIFAFVVAINCAYLGIRIVLKGGLNR